MNTLPTLQSDLLLLHPPAYFDFRNQRSVYFPFLASSGSVPTTPLYDYFPLGFKSLQYYLGERGHTVTLLNLGTLLMKYPHLDFAGLATALDVRMVGIDLHWMVHVQGSLGVAQRLKEIRPDIPVVFGGISSTLYAHELVQYPFIDMVLRGYDTHAPFDALLTAVKTGRDLTAVPNLIWKDAGGQVQDNGYSHKPPAYDYFIDWSRQPEATATRTLPISEVVTLTNVGCLYNCGWCGGSRQAFRELHGVDSTLYLKATSTVGCEFASLRNNGGSKHHVYPVNTYNETGRRLETFLDLVEASGAKSISYEQFCLTNVATLRKMVRANPHTTITLSPDSHDPRVAKLAGRGVYTNAELEAWIEQALALGIYQINIWYFIGLPEQGEKSVMETVEYCGRLLEKFKGCNVSPLICPMIPYLDPGSIFFNHPDRHGYRVFYRTVEEHRRAAERASMINWINYETRWLSRRELVHTGYSAIKALMQWKIATGHLPAGVSTTFIDKIDDALEFIDVVDAADNLADPQARRQELDRLGDEIQQRNELVFFGGVLNQSFPISRKIGGRWFDEMGWAAADLEVAVAA